ncbi:chitin synthase export chaperone [Moniliophthora roreri]|nr:chitin synthase export chaperone [Moniliophthora roreri]
MGIQFGSFDSLCQTAALVICPYVGSEQGIEPTCYSRNVDIGGTLIFQPSTCFIHIVAIIMTAIMIYHIRSKYTAVGRKEIVTFFWLYMAIQLLAIFLDSGIIPTANNVYPIFAAIYTGLVASAYCCLLINAFVGFQFAEDGTPRSLWFLRISCVILFAVGFFFAYATMKGVAGMSNKKPIALWIIYILWPVVCAAIYVVSQLILVFRTLEDRWPIGDIVFGTAFWVIGMVLLFAFSNTICDAIQHYIDGLFFSELCVLLAVMMVYKYWDSITREDLEFSVGSKATVWEVKDPLLSGHAGSSAASAPGGDYSEEDVGSSYHYAPPNAQYGKYGGKPASLVGGISGTQMYNQKGQGRGGYPPGGGY